MKNTNIFIALVVIVLLLLGVVYFTNNQRSAPGPASPSPQTSQSDDTASISSDLDQIDPGNVDAEFKDIDRDLDAL